MNTIATKRFARHWGTALLGVSLLLSMAAPVSAHAVATDDDSSPASILKITANGKIAFASKNQIWTINPNGSTLTKLTSGSEKKYAPTFSPDGKRIAYVNEVSADNRDLWIMNTDGTGKIQVTTSGHVSTGGAAWAPNGKRLAFGGPCVPFNGIPTDGCDWYQEPNIFALDTISAVAPFDNLKTLRTCVNASCEYGEYTAMDAVGRVAWTPQGGEISFYTQSYPFYGDNWMVFLSLDDHEVTQLEGINGGPFGFGNLGDPVYSSQGNLFGYSSNKEASPEDSYFGIKVCDYPAISDCRKFKEVKDDSLLAFAPMQNKTVFHNGSNGHKLYTADLDGTHRVFLTNGTAPSWQPVQ